MQLDFVLLGHVMSFPCLEIYICVCVGEDCDNIRLFESIQNRYEIIWSSYDSVMRYNLVIYEPARFIIQVDLTHESFIFLIFFNF